MSQPTEEDGVKFVVFCLVGIVQGLEDLVYSHIDPFDKTLNASERQLLNLVKERKNTNANHIQVYQEYLKGHLLGLEVPWAEDE